MGWPQEISAGLLQYHVSEELVIKNRNRKLLQIGPGFTGILPTNNVITASLVSLHERLRQIVLEDLSTPGPMHPSTAADKAVVAERRRCLIKL